MSKKLSETQKQVNEAHRLCDRILKKLGRSTKPEYVAARKEVKSLQERVKSIQTEAV